MSFIKSRLRRAEASVRSANCAECGLPPDGLGRIVLSDEWLPDYPEELCPKCDRRLWFIIEIVEPATVEGRGSKLMNRCLGTKRDNSPCTVTVEPPQTYCWWHDPANADKRKQAAARGGKRAGRGRPQAEIANIKGRLSDLADDVLEGRQDKGVAAVASQVLNVYLRAVSMEMKLREVEELERRMEELEALVAARKERTWRA